MTPSDDVFDSFEEILHSRPASNPWIAGSTIPTYAPDYELLAELVGIPVGAASGSETGRLAKAIDSWMAHELRRAGFGADEVWPRLTKPRVLPRDLALFIEGLPERDRDATRARVLRNKRVAPSDAKVLGRAYVKQVDVLIAQWSRGPELLVSTKTMVSSFRNNLPNRFEESYGDAMNLRGRFPLVSMGFLFLLRSTVTDEPGTLDRAIDMLRKLQQDVDVYDATCLLVCEWGDPPSFGGVTLRNDVVPDDLKANRFIGTLIERVLDRTPIDMHVNVREARDRRPLALDEADEAGDSAGD
ncbi:MAG TPA: hypothetical protein VNG13_03805 [Mycobacteriales bacterium]|nr:hypothetical protein [Mycobacteriales bacterium]